MPPLKEECGGEVKQCQGLILPLKGTSQSGTGVLRLSRANEVETFPAGNPGKVTYYLIM